MGGILFSRIEDMSTGGICFRWALWETELPHIIWDNKWNAESFCFDLRFAFGDFWISWASSHHHYLLLYILKIIHFSSFNFRWDLDEFYWMTVSFLNVWWGRDKVSLCFLCALQISQVFQKLTKYKRKTNKTIKKYRKSDIAEIDAEPESRHTPRHRVWKHESSGPASCVARQTRFIPDHLSRSRSISKHLD